MLEIRRLTRTLAGRRLPDAVSLAAAPGELIALLGPSGCGKSALLRCLAGLDPAESGDILMDGAPLTALAPHLRPVAFVPQGAALWPQMTVRANLAFGPESRGLSAAEVRARVDGALATLGITALADRRPATLSGGELQRAALARALALAPRLLLLDEPFAWTARAERPALLAAIRAHLAAAGACAILATHDAECAATADRLAVMHAGRILRTDTFTTLHRRPDSAAVAAATGRVNLIPARITRCGAGEFVADSALGELHGALADPEHEPAEGAEITVLMRPEHLRVSEFPPDENAFAGRLRPGVTQDGFPYAGFQTDAGPELTLLSPGAFPATDADSPLYAWILPEDLVALG